VVLRVELQLPNNVQSPRAARVGLEPFAATVPDSVLQAARLMVSELVSNSVKHAGLPDHEVVTVTAQSSRDRMRVEVADGGLGFEPDLPPQPGDTSGWGLFLVEQMADRWGVDPLARGVRVWFELTWPAPVHSGPGSLAGWRTYSV